MGNRQNITVRMVAGCTVVLLMFMAGPVLAQPNQAGPDQTTAEAPPDLLAIPTADIPERAVELRANLRRIEQLLSPDPDVEAIEVAMDLQTDELIELRSLLDALSENRASGRRMRDFRLAWSETSSQLEQWSAVLRARWSILVEEREELRQDERRWSMTRESEISDGAPAEVIENIDGVLQAILAVVERLREERDGVAVTINRVSAGREIAVEALEEIDAMEATVRQRVLRRDALPIWRGLGTVEADDLLMELTLFEGYWNTIISGYVERHSGQVFVFVAMFVFMLSALIALRRGRPKWPADDGSFDIARLLASRPFSTVLGITLALEVLVFPERFGPVSNLLFFLSLAVIIRLGRELVPMDARSMLYGVSVLAVLTHFVILAPDSSGTERLLLLVTLGVGLAMWAVRYRYTTFEGLTRVWRGAARTGVSLVVALLTVALAADVFGWVALSLFLAESVILSLYAALAWFVVARTGIGLVRLVPRTFVGRMLRSIGRWQLPFTRVSGQVIAAVVVVRWGLGTLDRFGLIQPLRQSLAVGLSASLEIGGLELSVGRLLAAIVILLAIFPLARLIQFVLREEMLARVTLRPGSAHLIATMVNYSVVGLGILLAAAAAGLSGTQLTVVSGGLAVGIGFGLQKVVSNFVSGLIVMFERPIRVGDVVQQDGEFGHVTRIGMRSTTVHSFDGAELIVPNEDLIAKQITNWSLSDRTRRIWLSVPVAYGTDPRQVLQILTRVATEHPLVLDDPAPTVVMVGYGDSALEFKLLVWLRLENYFTVITAMNLGVTDALKDAGITIPFPQRDLHVKSISPQVALLSGTVDERPELRRAALTKYEET